MSAQPESLFPRLMRPTTIRRSTKPRASSWSPDELAFAEQMILSWKSCSKKGHTPSASRTRRNRFVAIQLYRWLLSADNEDPKMTVDDVHIAIKAYSEDDYQARKCEGRYQSFGDWFRGCPDNIDKQLNRIGKPRGNDATREKAARVVRFNGWGVIAGMATKNGAILYEYVETQHQITRQDPSLNPLSRERDDQRNHDEWLRCLWRVLQQYRSMDKAAKINLMNRAARCFESYSGRPHCMKSLRDRNLRVAMACSLLERYGHKCKTGAAGGDGNET